MMAFLKAISSRLAAGEEFNALLHALRATTRSASAARWPPFLLIASVPNHCRDLLIAHSSLKDRRRLAPRSTVAPSNRSRQRFGSRFLPDRRRRNFRRGPLPLHLAQIRHHRPQILMEPRGVGLAPAMQFLHDRINPHRNLPTALPACKSPAVEKPMHGKRPRSGAVDTHWRYVCNSR